MQIEAVAFKYSGGLVYLRSMKRLLLILLLVLWAFPVSASLRCAQCGQAITGQYVEAQGNTYHSHHFLCGACHRPIVGKYYPKDGRSYHHECYVNLFSIRCTICQQPIEDRYISDYWGNRFHEHHLNDYPFCHYCQRPITQKQSKGGYRLTDGRILCGYCAQNAVLTQKQTDKYAQEARALMAKWGLNVPKIPVILVSRHQIEQINGHNTLGLTRSVLRGNKRSVPSISMCHGLPRQVFMGTMIHEYTHAWLFLKTGNMRRSHVLEEGICNFVSYLYQVYCGEAAASYFVKQLDENQDPIYGDGFRRVKAFAAANGSAAVVNQLANMDDFPIGY